MAEFRDKRKKEAGHVSPPYRRTRDGLWGIEYILDGKKKYEYRKTEFSAINRYNHWAKQFGQEPMKLPSKRPGQTDVAFYWEGQLRRAGELLIKSPQDPEVRQAAKTIASLATAAVRVVGHIPAHGEGMSDEDKEDVPEDVSKLTTDELKRLRDERK